MLSQQECRALVEHRLREGSLVIVEDSVSRQSWGWVFPIASRRYVETRDFSDVLIGAPHAFLVDENTGQMEAALSHQSIEVAIRCFEHKYGYRAPWWKFW